MFLFKVTCAQCDLLLVQEMNDEAFIISLIRNIYYIFKIYFLYYEVIMQRDVYRMVENGYDTVKPCFRMR